MVFRGAPSFLRAEIQAGGLEEKQKGRGSEGAGPAPGLKAQASALPTTAVGREWEANVPGEGPGEEEAVGRGGPCNHPSGVPCDEGPGPELITGLLSLFPLCMSQ